MKRKILLTVTALSVMVCIGGCGMVSMPKLSDEQEEQITEYAADLVMQHVTVYNNRLADLSLYVDQEEPLEESEEDTGKMDETADTPIVNSVEPASYDLQDVLLPDNFSLTFSGYDVLDSYPAAGDEDIVFAIDASVDKKLFIFHFAITNIGQDAAYIDITGEKPYCFIKVNDTNKYFIQTTLLEDDLTTFQKNVEAGETIPAVMVAEVPAELEGQIRSLELSVTVDDKTSVTNLQE